MTEQTSAGAGPHHHPEDLRPVEVKGQVRAVQMDPPTPDDHPEGGVFELLLENGDIITCPYPGQWHGYVAGAFQANDILTAVVTGIGEYSPDGRLLRITQIESYGTTWSPERQPESVLRIKNRDSK